MSSSTIWRLILVCGTLMVCGCRPRAQRSAQVTAPEGQSPVSTDDSAAVDGDDAGAGEEEIGKPAKKSASSREIQRRNFVVRAGGRDVGSAVLTVHEFRGGSLARIGLEYWLFRRMDPGQRRQSEYWFLGYCSESRRGRPAALWGTRAWHSDLEQFRLQTQGDRLSLTANRFGTVIGPKFHPAPKGHRYLVGLSERLQRSITRKAPAEFDWQRCLWREDPLKWEPYTYRYVTPDPVVSTEGKEYAAHRFDVFPAGGAAPTESVWVDYDGLPLRRVVPGLNGFEMLISERDRANDLSEAPYWSEAVELFGSEKAERTIQAADLSY